MSLPHTRIALETRLKNSWGNTTPIRWENVRFDPPMDVNKNPRPYIACLIKNGRGSDITLGSDNPWTRWEGMVIVQIFVPEFIGTKLATQYAETIKNIYLALPRNIQYLNSGIIRLYAPYAVETGVVGGYYVVNVTTPFRRDSQLV